MTNVKGVQFAAYHAVMVLIHERRSAFCASSETVFTAENDSGMVKIVFRQPIEGKDRSEKIVKLVVHIHPNGHATNYLTYEYPSKRDTVLLRFTVCDLNGYGVIPRLAEKAAAPDDDDGDAQDQHAWRYLANRLVIAYGVEELGKVRLSFEEGEVSFLSLLR